MGSQSAYLLRFAVNSDGTISPTPTAKIPLCGVDPSSPQAASCTVSPSTGGPGPKTGASLPSGMTLSPDGSKLYVALNGANTLGVVDTATNRLSEQIPATRPARPCSPPTGPPPTSRTRAAVPPTAPTSPLVRRHPDRLQSLDRRREHRPGSVVNLTTGSETQEIPVGLQPTALYQSASALFVANSNDDSFSIVNEATNSVAQTVRDNPVPGAKVGSYANAISMVGAHTLLVSIGRDNASTATTG